MLVKYTFQQIKVNILRNGTGMEHFLWEMPDMGLPLMTAAHICCRPCFAPLLGWEEPMYGSKSGAQR